MIEPTQPIVAREKNGDDGEETHKSGDNRDKITQLGGVVV